VVERLRFHLDENVTLAVGLGLRRCDIDVTTTQRVGLLGQPDEAQLRYIQESGRVIFTQDRDFLIIASQRCDHPGIAFCQKEMRSVGEVIAALVLMYEVLTPADMLGKVEFL
jgi:predicted nuclease of predicted toxin-antitoxin system